MENDSQSVCPCASSLPALESASHGSGPSAVIVSRPHVAVDRLTFGSRDDLESACTHLLSKKNLVRITRP